MTTPLSDKALVIFGRFIRAKDLPTFSRLLCHEVSTWLRSSKGFESAVMLQRKVQVKLVNDSGNISPLNGSSLVRIELTLKMLRHTFCRASKRSNHCSILLCWKRDRVEQRQQLTLVQIILQTPLKIGTRRHVNGINDNDSVVGRASEQLKGCTLLLDDTTHSMWLHTVEFTHVLRRSDTALNLHFTS